MGAITPILYQTAIPVFADVDPVTGNVTAASIERMISPKTRAIIVTHLFGYPADMAGICALAKAHGILVIEDCAQAYGAIHDGRPVGTIGDIGCFSLQQGKHITTGEGGLVVTDDEALARRLRLFIDKAWGYGDPKPDHYFAALNGRMTELQGAVALAQMGKLTHSFSRRQAMARRLTRAIAGLPGIETPPDTDAVVHSYWKYPLIVSPDLGGPVRLAQELRAFGIMSAPRYIQKPAFECAVIKDQRTFGTSNFPFNLARPEAVDYSRRPLSRNLCLPARRARPALERELHGCACRLPGRADPRGLHRGPDRECGGMSAPIRTGTSASGSSAPARSPRPMPRRSEPAPTSG